MPTPEEIAAQEKATSDKAAADKAAADAAKGNSEWKAPTKEEWERTQKDLEEVRKEAASRRVAAKNAEEQKTAAEKAKAEAEGRWADVLKIEKAEREKREADLAAVQKRLAELEPYEGTVKQEVAALKAKLGDKASVADGLTDAQALKVLRQFESLAAGPGAVKSTTSGKPTVRTEALPDISTMSPDEIQKLPSETRKALFEHHFPQQAAKRTNAF